MKIKWLGHSSFKITGTKTIYIDPWKIKGNAPADIILISHPHFDHFSPRDIEKIQGPSTIVVGPVESVHGLTGKVEDVLPGKKLKIGNVTIETFPAYNTDKNFHPKINKWLSYLIIMDGIRIFHTGDSDLIDDFKGIKTDILFVPISGHYVMNAEEAATLTNLINPKLTIPMHWGDIIGNSEDAKKFESLVKGKVKILEPEESFEFKNYE